VVALVLCELFEDTRDSFGKASQGAIAWDVLDTIVLEAVDYVTKSDLASDPTDALRITCALLDARRRWFD
jgi:hypothetical protein